MNCVTILTLIQLMSQMMPRCIAQVNDITQIDAAPHQISHLFICKNFNSINKVFIATPKWNDAQFEEDCGDEVQISTIIPPNDNEIILTIGAEPEEKSV